MARRERSGSIGHVEPSDESEDTKVRTYKQLFCNFADRTSMQGVGNVKNSKHIIARMIWSSLLLASLIALSFHLWYSLQQYYMYPKTAKINLGFANLPFPDITICNVNSVSKRRLEAYRNPSAAQLKRLVKALEPKTLVKEQLNVSLVLSDVAALYAEDNSSTDYFESFWNDFEPETFYEEYDSQYDGYEYTEEETHYDESQGIDNNENETIDYEESGDEQFDSENVTFYGGDGNVTYGLENNTNNCNDSDYGNNNVTYRLGNNTYNGNEPGYGNDSDYGLGNNTLNGNESHYGNNDYPVVDDDAQGTKKKRKKRFADFLQKFNFTEFDPTFNDWFRLDKDSLVTEDEYSGKVDDTTKLEALFRRTYMKLTRWERGGLGHNITRMLLKCTFAGRTCNARTLFRLHQTPEYGNCWTLSSRKFVSRDSGPNAGLSLILNLQSTDYLSGFTHGYGARIQIHNRGAYPDPYQDGISLPAAMETDIGLKLITFERLSGKYGNCENGEEFRKLHNRPYSRRTCQIFCHASHVIETCGCYDVNTEEVAVKTGLGTGLMSCNTVDEYQCLHRLEKAFQRKDIACKCENPCKESAYIKSMSNHQWPTDEYAQLLLAGVCKDDRGACKAFIDSKRSISELSNNFLKLNIYFEDLNYEEIKEEPDIGVNQILSDIGGAIGLWIGLSVVSFCEVLQLGFEILKLTKYKICHAGERETQDLEKKGVYGKDTTDSHDNGYNSTFDYLEKYKS